MEDNSKPRSVSKSKENRYNQPDGQNKKSSKPKVLMRNDISQLSPPKAYESVGSIKKVLGEANKIVKFGVEKQYALLEKDATLQSSNETIDNLRKNIIHLQMEYEKLDQNYQREISHRSDIIRRMDATKIVVESAVSYSNALSASIKQLEDDKLKIAEFYEVIHQEQKEIENKYVKMENEIKRKEISLNSKVEEVKKMLSMKGEVIEQQNNKLNSMNEQLHSKFEENKKLELIINQLKENLSNYKISLEEQQRLSSRDRENIDKMKLEIKELKNEKVKYQKLWNIKKREVSVFKKKNKVARKSFLKKETVNRELINRIENLKIENEEQKIKLAKQQECEIYNIENWESQKADLVSKITEKENENDQLKILNENLKEKSINLMNEKEKESIELKALKCEIDEVDRVNKKLQVDISALNKENESKEMMILDLKKKISECENDLTTANTSLKNELKKYREMMKGLEKQLSDVEKILTSERAEKETIKKELNNIIEENARMYELKLKNMEDLVGDKTQKINKLMAEITEKDESIQAFEEKLSHASTRNKKSTEKLEKDMKTEKAKNKELIADLEEIKQNQSQLNEELEQAKNQISSLERKLSEEKSTIKELKTSKNELEKNATVLKKEADEERKFSESLKQKLKKSENEVNKLQVVVEENSSLKRSVSELKGLLEGTEARVEAYKVVVKKLEAEKAEGKASDSEEILKLKSEISRLQEELKKEKRFESQFQVAQNKADLESVSSRVRQKQAFSPSNNPGTNVENEPKVPEISILDKIPQPVTPLQTSKKTTSTPRRILSSTPQPKFRNLTPITKKRDPYEFDSDSSVERYDTDQVLKVFNSRQKKEMNKKYKVTK